MKQSSIHQSVHPLTIHAPTIYPSIYHSSIYPFTHSSSLLPCFHPFIHLSIHPSSIHLLSIPSIYAFIHHLSHSSIHHPSIHSLTSHHPSIIHLLSIHPPSIHLSIHPPIHPLSIHHPSTNPSIHLPFSIHLVHSLIHESPIPSSTHPSTHLSLPPFFLPSIPPYSLTSSLVSSGADPRPAHDCSALCLLPPGVGILQVLGDQASSRSHSRLHFMSLGKSVHSLTQFLQCSLRSVDPQKPLWG